MKAWIRRALPAESLFLFGILVVLTLVYQRFNPNLLTINGLHSVSTQFAPLILVAMAQALIMIVVGVDLSIGAQVSLATCMIATYSGGSAGHGLFAIALALGVGLLVNGFVGSLVTFLRLPAIIVTLGTSYVISGLALTVRPVPGGQVPAWMMSWYASKVFGIVPAPLIVVLVVIVGWKVIKSTPLGLAIYATGDNASGAYVSGVSTVKARLAAYALAGVITTIAGVIISAQIGSGDPILGTPYTLNSIAAAVFGGVSFLGGQGRMRSVVLGALVLGFLFNVLFFSGVSPFYQYVIQGLALIVAVGIKVIPDTTWGRRLKNAATISPS